MGIIYKEGIRYKKASFVRWVTLLFITLIAANILSNGRYYSSQYNIEFGIILLAGGILSLYAMKGVYELAYVRRISYTYKLIDKELIFERATLNSSRVVLSVDAKYIEFLAPAHKARGLKGIDRTYKFLCCPLRNRMVYCCVVNHDGKRIKFYFQPSVELVNKLDRTIAYYSNLKEA